MNMHILWGVSLLAIAAAAQVPDNLGKPGASSLALPRSGVPLSLTQEERHSQGSGPATVQTIHSTVYRDSTGKLRIESTTQDASGTPSAVRTILVDPVDGSTVLLIRDTKRAHRMPGAKGESLMGAGLIADQQLEDPGKWKIATEHLGQRMILGIAFDGTRIVQTADRDPHLQYSIEKWYSEELKLTALEVATGPNGTYTARITELHRGEPDQTLFTIPENYKVIEIDLK